MTQDGIAVPKQILYWFPKWSNRHLIINKYVMIYVINKKYIHYIIVYYFNLAGMDKLEKTHNVIPVASL